MLHLGTRSCISGKCGNSSKSLMLILLRCVLLLLCGAEEHTFPLHSWTQPKTCTLLPPAESPPARSHQRALHTQCKLVQRTKGTSDNSLVPARSEPLCLPTAETAASPIPTNPRHYSEQHAPLPLASSSSCTLHWVGRKSQCGVTGNCLSTQEQDAKTSSAGLPRWISREHGFPHE